MIWKVCQTNSLILLYTPIEIFFTVKYAGPGSKQPKTIVAKRHDWYEMAINYSCSLLHDLSEIKINYLPLRLAFRLKGH